MNLPKGFRYAAGYAGIRKTMNDDLALIVSDRPAAAAAVFTTESSRRRARHHREAQPRKLQGTSPRVADQRRECQLRDTHR